MTSAPRRVGRAIRFGVLELALFLLGMLFIRREVWQMHAMPFELSTWQQAGLLPLVALDGMLTGAFATRAEVQNTPAYKKLMRWGTPIFFLLYVGCCTLCERLHLGVFPMEAAYVLRTIGIAIVIGGIVVRFWSEITTTDLSEPGGVRGPYRLLRHPDAAGRLLALTGLPLVFNAWLPLLALPGVIILLKWHISDQEAFRISQLGEPYLEYRKKTWNLIPYLY